MILFRSYEYDIMKIIKQPFKTIFLAGKEEIYSYIFENLRLTGHKILDP